MAIFEQTVELNAPARVVFDWHKRDDAFSFMCPPFPPVKILAREGGIVNGARTKVRVGIFPASFDWELVHCEYEEGRKFCDMQIRGPFKSWKHEHIVESIDDGHCRLIDRITYELPMLAKMSLVGEPACRLQLRQLFDFRHAALRRIFNEPVA